MLHLWNITAFHLVRYMSWTKFQTIFRNSKVNKTQYNCITWNAQCISVVTAAVQFSIYNCLQINTLYRMFTECINRCDVGENFSNTMKPTISLLPELHYRSNYKLNIRENLCRYPEMKRVYRLAKWFGNWIKKTVQFVQQWITRVCLTVYSPVSSLFASILALSNYTTQ